MSLFQWNQTSDLVLQKRIMGVFTANHENQVDTAAGDHMKHSK